MKAVGIRTEHLIDPLGIDITNPRIFWKAEGGERQSAYRIVAKVDGQVAWDSGKVDGSSMHADYPMPLRSRERVSFAVCLYDETGEAGQWSEECHFEMGLLCPEDWAAHWIKAPIKARKGKHYPADYFKKEFDLGKCQKGRIYASALGLYEISLNGHKVGDSLFTPGSTDYRKRVQYQTYDVTSLLKEGHNVIEVVLGDGWFRGSSGSKGRLNTYGKETAFILQLEAEGLDGKAVRVLTDSTWKWSNDGPIVFNDLKDGERVDARLTPTYSGLAALAKERRNLTSSNNVSVKEHERFAPIESHKTPSGKIILKFPQNLSGYIAFAIKAKGGEKMKIRLGELLDEQGELTQKNIQCIHHGKPSPLQEIDYTFKPGLNEYRPKFFYGGFQYAEIETDVSFRSEDFVAVACYSGFKETCRFECSDPLIEKLFGMTLWSLKSNSTDFPSDCPTRERMGWTGDSEVFFNTASYLVDYAAFSRKHVNDIFDRQWKSGRLPQIAPYAHEDWFMWVMNGSVGWACAGVYIPLYFYLRYGDERLLKENFDGMVRYGLFMVKRAGKWGGPYAKPLGISRKNRKYAVNAGQSYGEWAEPNDVCAFKWYDFASPHPEESTAYTYFTLKRILEVASILHQEGDKRLEKIREYSEGGKRAYQEMVSKPRFSLDTDRQAKLVRPLYMGLLTDKQADYARKRLIAALDHYGWRLGTGFLSTPFILDVLSSIDLEYAYRLLKNTERPGWLFMAKSGASTIWESWEGPTTPDRGIASLNHYSKGAVVEWLIRGMCGINVAGENSFLIKPLPGGDIMRAYASYDSIYGTVTSAFEKAGIAYRYLIEIPPNCQAEVELLDGRKFQVGPGRHEF